MNGDSGSLTPETVTCSKDDPDADHEWEYSHYDPSVGLTTNSKTCVSCGRTEFVDYEGSEDDFV